MNNAKLEFDLGKRLIHFYDRQYKSWYELSMESTVPLTTMTHILHGKTKNPGFFTVWMLCRAMGVSLSEFVGEGKRLSKGEMGMHEYDEAVLACFLENQGQLFPEPVAQNEEEAEEFLEDCMAVVVNSAKEVKAYFEEVGVDFDEYENILEADEVFEIGDGRYLIVEG